MGMVGRSDGRTFGYVNRGGLQDVKEFFTAVAGATFVQNDGTEIIRLAVYPPIRRPKIAVFSIKPYLRIRLYLYSIYRITS